MTARPVVPRRAAVRDAEAAIDYYLGEAGEEIALRFVNSLDRAFRHLARHPESGSPRYAHELDLPGLRSWALHGFPHLVFYVAREDHIDVWRILHGQRDIPAWLRASQAT